MHIVYLRLITIVNEETVGSLEYHIASCMIENMDQLYKLSIGNVAKLCNTSKSTISKFVREMGFEDYIDFKLEAIKEREKDVYNRKKNSINITDYIQEYGEEAYIKVLITDIKNLFRTVDKHKIETLIEEIYRFKKIAAFGEIYSETAALNFQYKMSFYRKFIYTTLNDRKQESYIREAGEDTLLIIFSNSGKYVSNSLVWNGSLEKDCFNKTKAKVALITSNKEIEKDERVDIVINLEYSESVQNHPILFQLMIEQIALAYQNKYGFPMDMLQDDQD